MVTRSMMVIDPLYTKKCPHLPTEQLDEIIAWKLHYALFNCLTEYYAGWPASKEGWSVNFPAFAETKFTWCCSTFLLLLHSHISHNQMKTKIHQIDPLLFLFDFDAARRLVPASST